MAQKDDEKQIYRIEITEKQAKVLSYVCDNFSRLICGQDWAYQELFKSAWEKRCKEATGETMDEKWDGGWEEMMYDAKSYWEETKKRFWGSDSTGMNGLGYDDTADMLFDLHQVIRHQLWLDSTDDEKSNITVDSYKPTRHGTEPLATISRIDKTM
jgi:hypothetical protein